VATSGHAFVDDLDAPVLSPEDRHHLERVLRLRPGDEVTVSDGAGGWRRCRFGPALEPVGEVGHRPRPVPAVTVAFALVKGQRPEWAVQKLTELGVDRIVPLLCARSVVRWPAREAGPGGQPAREAGPGGQPAREAGPGGQPAGEGGGQLDRLRRVAREAAVQSRRVWLPEVAGVTPVAALLAGEGAALAHPGGGPPALSRPVVLVGPEGGWDERELAAAPALVGLGPSVLRTETAAVVAGTLLCALRAGIVTPG
jgi:16S rRNA (uracil1498-N3)-methyltransferase